MSVDFLAQASYGEELQGKGMPGGVQVISSCRMRSVTSSSWQADCHEQTLSSLSGVEVQESLSLQAPW